jgi:MFS family permease
MTAAETKSDARTSSKFWVLLTASLVSSLIMLDSNVVAVSLPTIGRALEASFTDIQWVISAYVLTYAALLLAAGNYADLAGRRKAMLIGLVIFAVASAACGIANSALLLNLARGAQGIGGALLLTASLAIISHDFAGEQRAGALRSGPPVSASASPLAPLSEVPLPIWLAGAGYSSSICPSALC